MTSAGRRIGRGIRAALPIPVRNGVARAGAIFGTDVAFPSMFASFMALKAKGFEPTLAIDVGAYKGDWAALFQSVFPRSKVLMVEPQAAKQPVLRATCNENRRLETALLGAVVGTEVDFFEMETGSSVFGELTDVPRQSVKKQLTTLDALLTAQPDGWVAPDFLKLDVQGSEIEVLKGATASLGRCSFVLLEVSLIPYNDGAPLAPEVLRYMWDQGFTLVDFCSQMRRPDGFLRQTDLLFINDDRKSIMGDLG